MVLLVYPIETTRRTAILPIRLDVNCCKASVVLVSSADETSPTSVELKKSVFVEQKRGSIEPSD